MADIVQDCDLALMRSCTAAAHRPIAVQSRTRLGHFRPVTVFTFCANKNV